MGKAEAIEAEWPWDGTRKAELAKTFRDAVYSANREAPIHRWVSCRDLIADKGQPVLQAGSDVF